MLRICSRSCRGRVLSGLDWRRRSSRRKKWKNGVVLLVCERKMPKDRIFGQRELPARGDFGWDRPGRRTQSAG